MAAGKKFFNEYKDERDDGDQGGGSFLSKAEKELLVEEAVPFPILSVSKTTTQFGVRWMIGTELEGEPRMIGFSSGKVFSRDRQLAAVEAWLNEGGAAPVVKIVMAGRSQILVDAE